MNARRISDSPALFDIPLKPDFSFEQQAIDSGRWPLAGIDEAGRGPLAGPVVAAAVILNPECIPPGLDDSKRLNPVRRNALFSQILQMALGVSFASISAEFIDATDIRKATLEAMRRALCGLTPQPIFALADGRDIPHDLTCPASALIKGDQRCQSIAAASIIAKVSRDRIMIRAGEEYPQYGFDKHKGYGTLAHRKVAMREGCVERLHRRSFAPFRYGGTVGAPD